MLPLKVQNKLFKNDFIEDIHFPFLYFSKDVVYLISFGSNAVPYKSHVSELRIKDAKEEVPLEILLTHTSECMREWVKEKILERDSLDG